MIFKLKILTETYGFKAHIRHEIINDKCNQYNHREKTIIIYLFAEMLIFLKLYVVGYFVLQ